MSNSAWYQNDEWTAALESEPADFAPLSTAEQGSVGIVWLSLLPKNTEEKKFIFEYVMQLYLWSSDSKEERQMLKGHS